MAGLALKKKEVPKTTADQSMKNTTTQRSLPYLEVYHDGMIQSEPGVFSVVYSFPDVSFKTLSDDEQDAFFDRFETYLNSIDSSEHVQFNIINTLDDIDLRFASVSLQERGDHNDKYRKEMNKVIYDKMKASRGSIITKKYVTYSIEAPTVDIAVQRFKDIDIRVGKDFRAFIHQEAHKLTMAERLEMLATIYGTESSVFFVHDEEGHTTFDEEGMKKMNLTTKDVIAPSAMKFNPSDMMIGDYYAQSFYLQDIANLLSTDFIGNLADINCRLVMSIDIRPLDDLEATKIVHNRMVLVDNEIATKQKKAVKEGYSPDLAAADLQAVRDEIEGLQQDMTVRDQRVFYLQLNLTHFATDPEELKRNGDEIKAVATKNRCSFRNYTLMQERGLDACLPLGVNHTYVTRLLSTEGTAAFMPFTEVTTFDKNGIYYGVNSINKSVIILDRLKGMNYNGLVFGASGSGKSFSSKREMINVILNTDDDIYIIDPDGEYLPLANAFGGSEIEIAPGNGKYINPFDLDIDKGDDKENNPVVLQGDFIAGIVETMIARGRQNILMSPTQVSVLGRCINKVYEPYLDHLNDIPDNPDGTRRTIDREVTPTLQDLFQELLNQPEYEGQQIALAIESYVSGNYDTFAHRTNVDITNRFTVFNILNIGNNLRELGLKVCLNMIWNKAVENRKKGKRTWVYIDEFHLLLNAPTSAEFIASMWKRARKFGCILTGITQNPEDVLKSASSRAIMSNTNFVEMLNEAASDAYALQQLLTLSNNELQYITNVEFGKGLIKFGTGSIPFNDSFPMDTELYKIMSTKATEQH